MAHTLAWRAWLLVWLACTWGCSPPRPDVLLITIDTLRADRVSAYGHGRETTPRLDALAAEGVRFENAYSSSSWTAPSVASLLTSLQPASHGIERGHVEQGDTITQQEAFGDAVPLWAELLAAAGYRTFGITANGHLDARFGFARGFDRYRCVGFQDLVAVETALAGFRREIASASPWFVWIHLFDPHAPYTPRADWVRRSLPGFRGADGLGSVRAASRFKELGVRRGTPAFELVNLLYEGEIAHADAALGRILAELAVDADDLVVVTSDHGEAFLEHDRFGHGYNLHEEVTRVPLVLRLPGRELAGRVVREPAAGVDVLPTVLDALGIPAPPRLQGRSLLPLARGETVPPRDVVMALNRFSLIETRALRRGRWKYVRRYADGEQSLFDLEVDPGEQRNLAGEQPERVRELRDALERMEKAELSERIEPRLEPLTEEELEMLRSLGYADGA